MLSNLQFVIAFPLIFSLVFKDLLDLNKRLNANYAEFLASDEGRNFTGVVSVVADSIGSIMIHDLLCSASIANPATPPGACSADTSTFTVSSKGEGPAQPITMDEHITMDRKLVSVIPCPNLLSTYFSVLKRDVHKMFMYTFEFVCGNDCT